MFQFNYMKRALAGILILSILFLLLSCTWDEDDESGFYQVYSLYNNTDEVCTLEVHTIFEDYNQESIGKFTTLSSNNSIRLFYEQPLEAGGYDTIYYSKDLDFNMIDTLLVYNTDIVRYIPIKNIPQHKFGKVDKIKNDTMFYTMNVK